MQASPFPHPWSSCSSFYRTKLLRFPDKQLTSLAGSFGYVSPEVIKDTGHRNPMDIRWTGYHHSQTDYKFISLSAQPSSPMFPSAVAPLPFLWQHHNPHLAKLRSQNRVCRTGALFPIEIKPNPLFDVSLPLIRSIVVPRRLYATLGLPLPTHHPSLISPPLSDKIGVLEQSGLCLDWRQATNRSTSIAASASRLSTQSSGRWNDLDPNLHIVTQAP